MMNSASFVERLVEAAAPNLILISAPLTIGKLTKQR